MKLQGRIQVEPLDDERLVNIERHIVANAKIGPAPERTPRHHLAFAGALVAVAAAALIGWKLHAPGAPAVTRDKPQSLAVATEAQRSTLALEGATIASDPGTTFDVTREAGKVVVVMTRGKLDLAVEHREGRLLVVRAGDTDVEDVGTKFSVAWDGTHDVDVRVREGAVKVKHAREQLIVAKGQEWQPATGVVPLVEVAATEAPPVPVPPVVVAVNEPPPLLHERHARVPAPPRVEDAAPPELGEPMPTPSHAAAKAAAIPSDPYVDLKSAIRRQPLALDPKIDGQRDAAAEIGRLKKIAYSPTTLGDEASRALYTIAVLLHKPLKQDAEALRTLDMYRRRFAKGKELGAVLWLRVRITCGRAIDDDCRKAAYGYQHELPQGDAADVAIRITNAQ
ncbi:MAG: FecR domain-containing protein [Acidobacteriota bacterium]